MKNIKKPNKRGKSSQAYRIQTAEVKPFNYGTTPLGGITKEPNPHYEAGKRRVHIIHKQTA